jgi:hypothetical protein
LEWNARPTIELSGNCDLQRRIGVRNVGGSLSVKFEAFHDYVHTGQAAAHSLSKLWGACRLVGLTQALSW